MSFLNGGDGDYALQMARARATKQVGDKIIALLASVENFQRKMLEKKKFVMRTDYVFTLDRIPNALHPKVLANETQVQEWRDLFNVDGLLIADGVLGEGGLTVAVLQNQPYHRLPVDTRHFDAAFKAELLDSVDDLDALTDGTLFSSENLQALILMTEKYRKQVKCIYIDPPYNTGFDGFLYKDAYRHSSWLSMMSDRIAAASPMLQDKGLVFSSIDDIEVQNLRRLADEWYGENAFVGTLTWIATTQPDNIGRARYGLQQNNEFILLYSNCPRVQLPPFKLASSGKPKLYPHEGRLGRCRFEIIERSFEGAYARTTMRFPILNQTPRPGKQWQIGEELARALEAAGKVEIVDGIVKRAVYPEDEENDEGLIPFWAHLTDVGSSQVGKAELTNILGRGHNFDTVKPIALLVKLISHVKNDGYFLDFFAGSGTTGHAVIALNRAAELDGTNDKRKYILCESGNYFDTLLLRRLKKAIFASNWNNGKATSRDAISHTIKYHTLEQYEDSLNNLQLRPGTESQQALDVFGEDYLLRYMLDFDTAGSPSLLNVDLLADPLAYTLRVKSGDDFIHQTVDLPETFSYLLGLHVRKVRAFNDAGREYRAVLGEKDGKLVAHIWRKSSDLADNEDGLARDAAFLTRIVLPALLPTRPDRVFLNGAFTLADAENCEPELFRLMFTAVGA